MSLRHLKGSPDMPKHIAKLKKDLDARTKKDLAALTPMLAAWMRPLSQLITALGNPTFQDGSGGRWPRRIDTGAIKNDNSRHEDDH